MKFKSIWDCEASQDTIAPSGTKVIFPYVWSHTETGITPHKDIEITLDNDSTYGKALALVEKEMLNYVRSHGADDIRQYYIKYIKFEDGVLKFEWGT